MKLWRGDCLAILPTLPRGSIDLVATDPPYSSGGAFRGDRCGPSTRDKYQQQGTIRVYSEFAGDTRDQRSFAHWSCLWLSSCLELARPGAPALVFTDWRQIAAMTDALQGGGWIWRGIVPWDKTEAARPIRGRFRAQCEYVAWGSKGAMTGGGPCLPGLFRHAVHRSTKCHVAGKPIALMEQLLAIQWHGRGRVLDPFMGGGATAIAAIRSEREFWGMESDPDIFDEAVDRIERELERPLPGEAACAA